MQNKITLKSEIFEIMMKKALLERYYEELETLKHETEDCVFPETFEKKANKIANYVGRNEILSGLGKTVIRIAAVIAVIMGITFAGLLTQPEIYADVIEIIRSVFSTHDSYEYTDKQNNEIIFDNRIFPKYIPDGYTLRQVFYQDDSVVMVYDTIDEYELHFKYGLAYDKKISIDNENTTLQEFERKGIKYYYYEAISQDEFDTLLWYSNKYYFMIKAQLPKDEIVKIAEKIES